MTLEIDKGEFVAVVGRSGSGKTTMLDLLGLLLKPTSGNLFIDDVDTTKLGDRDRARMRARKVGFVFQEYNLLSGLNVPNCLAVRCSGSPSRARWSISPR